jgi:3-phosphoshikimate 1-carboxyvinyltransferase
MNVELTPVPLRGTIAAIPSKSLAHRALIAAALGSASCELTCPATSRDIDATAACLVALGAGIKRMHGGFLVTPLVQHEAGRAATLDCDESGSTLRFILPVAAALGATATVTGRGRLAARPLGNLVAELCRHGITATSERLPLTIEGTLEPGTFVIDGTVTSQYVTGLLLAATQLAAPSRLLVTTPIESWGYVAITLAVLERFGAQVTHGPLTVRGTSYHEFCITPGPLSAGGHVRVEGDWSNAGFWLAAAALGAPVAVTGLNPASVQGDRAILAALEAFGVVWDVQDRAGVATITAAQPASHAACVNVATMPDAAPELALVASLVPGVSRIEGAARLRVKESDRLATIAAGLTALGAHVSEEPDALAIQGVAHLTGGVVDAANDHRIAMMAAIAATRATAPVTITGAECVSKSYPAFFDDYRALGGLVHTLEAT